MKKITLLIGVGLCILCTIPLWGYQSNEDQPSPDKPPLAITTTTTTNQTIVEYIEDPTLVENFTYIEPPNENITIIEDPLQTNDTEGDPIIMVQTLDYSSISKNIVTQIQGKLFNNMSAYSYVNPYDHDYSFGPNSILYRSDLSEYWVAFRINCFWIDLLLVEGETEFFGIAAFDTNLDFVDYTTSVNHPFVQIAQYVDAIADESTDLTQTPIIRLYDSGGKIYCAYPISQISIKKAGIPTILYTISTDSWTVNNNALASHEQLGYDLNAIGTLWEQIYFGSNDDTLADKIYIYNTAGRNETSAGYESRAWRDDATGIIYWLKNDGGAVKLRSLTTAGVFAYVETISATGGTDLNMNTSMYWKQGSVEIAMWKDNLWYKEASTWKQVSNITANNPIPHWTYNTSSNVYEIYKFTFGQYYLEIINGTVIIQQVTDIDPVSGWDDYIIDGDGAIYQLTATEKYYPEPFPVKYGYGMIPTAYFVPPQQGETYIANQYMKVYTDNGTLAYQGYIEKTILNNTRTRYLIPIIHPAQYELLQNVIINETTQTFQTILENAISANCKIITAGTITSSANTYTLTNWRLRLIDLFMIADYVENYRWRLNPDCTIDRDDGLTATTYSVTDANVNPFHDVDYLPTYIQYSRVNVKGALGTTDGKYNANANEYGTLQLNFPVITDSTILQEIADMVGPQMNQTINRYTFSSITQKVILPGKTIALNSAAEGIASDDYVINEMTVDLVSHKVDLDVQDVRSFPKQTDLGVNPFTNQQQISRVYNYTTEVKTTADAASTRLGTLSSFSVEKNDNQTITTATATKVAFDDEVYDENTEYDAATNYRFTAKQAGLYHFNASLLFSASAWTAGQYCALHIRKNNTLFRVLDSYEIEANGTLEIQLVGTCHMKLAVNDYVEIFVIHNRGSDTTTYNNQLYNYFEGHRCV